MFQRDVELDHGFMQKFYLIYVLLILYMCYLIMEHYHGFMQKDLDDDIRESIFYNDIHESCLL